MIRQPIRLTLGAATVTGLLVAGTGAAYGTAAAGAAPMHS
jgi:hypothetical protein